MCFKKSIFVSQLQSITFHQTVFNGIKYIVTNTENTKIHIPVKDILKDPQSIFNHMVNTSSLAFYRFYNGFATTSPVKGCRHEN